MNYSLPDILLDTDDYIALNKPAGLLSIPDREGKEISLKKMLQEKYGEIFTVHRIDKGTSGVIIFGKNTRAHQFLSTAFEDRRVEKYYTGLVQGIPSPSAQTINQPLMPHPGKSTLMVINKRGKEAITDYTLLESFGKVSLLEFRIHTGRTHQIRVHMQFAGHPLLCDELYGDGKPILLSSFKKAYKLSQHEEEERPILNRLALHAQRLVFIDQEGMKHTLEAPVPKDFRALLQQLRKLKRPGRV
ncbi:MAG TPA: RNA pseudouridine synthase [Flavitalea sp.]|nr:RNA pseudouridine synthase [Flavitalea sp.]